MMIEHLAKPTLLPLVNQPIHPGAELTLQLVLHNQMSEAVLFRPTLDDWVIDKGQIIPITHDLEPNYLYLVPGSEARCKITIPVPFQCSIGTILKTWLRFPGILEDAIPITLKIDSPAQRSDQSQGVELPLLVTFPPTRSGEETSFGASDQTTANIFGLMSGLMDLDQIPSRWLVAELLVILCQRGNDYAQTQAGSQLLSQLSRTCFFKNGVQAFSLAQVPHWISSSLSAANTILNSRIGQTGLLHLWERWFLSLAQTDLEGGQKKNGITVPPLSIDTFVTQLGMDADRWFAGIVLGLAQISPRLAASLSAIANQPRAMLPYEDGSATQASYSLVAGLPGLDTLPARWLVVELLILLCQAGNDYAQTPDGQQLLDSISRTRLFKNGVLAFASAQAPRWITISQSAASAYQASFGGQGGLLPTGEQWLWSLVPGILKTGEMGSKIAAPQSSRATVVKEMGMDAEGWCAGILLGLTLVSPRIAATVKAIAAQAPPPLTQQRPSQVMLNNVLGEGGSIQR